MDLDGADVTPGEGRVLLRFVDDEEDDATTSNGPDTAPVDYDGCLALILAVGPKCGTLKKGQMAICSSWARDGMKLGKNTVLASAYDIVGTLK